LYHGFFAFVGELVQVVVVQTRRGQVSSAVSAPNESKEASFSEILILFCFCFRVSAKTPLPADGCFV
jgi:hypothetical protein